MNKIRRMNPDDISAVLRIQGECYPPSMNEEATTILGRLEAAPDTAWVAEDGDGVAAYLVAYRSILGTVTPLGSSFFLPAVANCLYLHDLAVSRRARGTGTAMALVSLACDMAQAEGLPYSALVSVQASKAFWTKLGYTPIDELEAAQINNLASYDPPQCYMVRPLRRLSTPG